MSASYEKKNEIDIILMHQNSLNKPVFLILYLNKIFKQFLNTDQSDKQNILLLICIETIKKNKIDPIGAVSKINTHRSNELHRFFVREITRVKALNTTAG